MRKVLGGLVLVAGVGGLGWWGAENQAERMQAQIRGQADTIAAGALHGVQAITLGRDITLTGLVDSEDERAALIAAMEEINGQRQVRDALVTLPVADPYITRATRENDAQPMVSGSIPIEAARAEIGRAGGGGIAALSLASGAPEGWQDAYLAGLAGLLEMPGGDLELNGQELRLSGAVRNPAARDQVLARIGDLPEGYTLVSDGITLLDDGTPPVFDLTKGADGAVAAMGKLPEGVSQTDLAEALGAAAITGTAKPGFVGSNDGPAALVAAGALGQLNEGLLRFDDGQIVLSGVAANPDVTTAIEDALAQLPALYEVDTSAVTLADDGRPVGFEIAFNATAGGEVTGKLPEGLDAAALGAALGLPAMGGDAATSFIGGDQSDGILAQLSGLKRWMAITETAILTYGPDGLDVDIATVLGADTALVRDGIAAEIDGAQVRVSQASAIGADGRTRVNIVTGVNERVSNGFWLPDVRFEANPESCTSRSQDVLAAAKINFVTGSASLDPLSVSTVNRIASIVQRCVIEGGLRAEIGGHTDNTGNAQDNFQLSFERARAVEQALVDRGVPGQGMQSVGHGDTQPVASNDTDAGRAANRRTSIVWTNIAQ